MGNIVWLASYPKSGNTWFRIFVRALLYKEEGTQNLFDLSRMQMASMRSLIDDYSGIKTSDLTPLEVDNLRPDVYRIISESTQEPCFIKTHEVFKTNSNQKPIYSPKATKGVIYFVRNPLDIVGSYAYFFNISIERAIRQMGNQKMHYNPKMDRLLPQVRYKVGSWSTHVESWLNAKELNVKIVKYEDMVANTKETFTEMVRFCGLDCTDRAIEDALTASQFNKLQRLEEKQPFEEKYPQAKSFFRKGKTANWKNELKPSEVDAIIASHQKMMIKLGYLTADGSIIE